MPKRHSGSAAAEQGVRLQISDRRNVHQLRKCKYIYRRIYKLSGLFEKFASTKILQGYVIQQVTAPGKLVSDALAVQGI